MTRAAPTIGMKAGKPVEGGFVIETGKRPIGQLRGKQDQAAAFKVASQLKPGQWFVWINPPKVPTTMVRGWCKKHGLKVVTYLSVDKLRIVAHAEAGDDYLEK